MAKPKARVEALDIPGTSVVDTDLRIAILELGRHHSAAKPYRANRDRIVQAFREFMSQTGPFVPDNSDHAMQRLHDDLVTAIDNRDGKKAVRFVRREQKEFDIPIALCRRNSA